MSNAIQQPTLPPPNWYPDPADPSSQRWWDGRQWTAYTAPLVASAPTASSYLGMAASPTPMVAPAINSMATRGMIYSLVALVFNPFGALGIGGLVLGVRALRRAPHFAPEASRRGQAIAAIVVGITATVVSILLVAAAITVSNQQRELSSYDQQGMQQEIKADIEKDSGLTVDRVDCPAHPAIHAGSLFDCTATMSDARLVAVHVTIHSDDGTYTWVTEGLHDLTSSST